MIIELKGATLVIQHGFTQIMSDVPQECTNCHRMTHFFENLWGRTRCTMCAIEEGVCESRLLSMYRS